MPEIEGELLMQLAGEIKERSGLEVTIIIGTRFLLVENGSGDRAESLGRFTAKKGITLDSKWQPWL